MRSHNLMAQATASHRLDHRSKSRLYLWIFFDLADVALVNSRIVYQQLNSNLNSFDSKNVIAYSFLGKYSNHQRAFFQSQPAKRKSTREPCPADTPVHQFS